MSNALTDKQLKEFARDGYIVLPAAFTEAEVRKMRSEADYILELIINSSLANGRRSKRLDWLRFPDGRQIVRKIQPTNDLSLYLTQISEDPRFLDPMHQIMGEEPILMEEKLNYKEPLSTPVAGVECSERDDSFPIHNDWAYFAAQNYPQSILSSAISMDECTEDSGPIRVWPGSHRAHLEHEKAPVIGLQVKPGLIDVKGAKSVLAPAGSVMIFHALLVHDSRPNVSGRPRRLMIYSHYPKSANMGFDVRNGPMRLRESPYEEQYHRLKTHGKFKDAFRAPVFPGIENAGPLG